jgi:Zn finger protein HypA/HybF involved in hydrogenase expression
MQELSIMHNPKEPVGKDATKRGASTLRGVPMGLGAVAGALHGTIEFSYPGGSAETMLDQSALFVKELPVKVYLWPCAAEMDHNGAQRLLSPRCDIPGGDIRQGRKLKIEWTDIEMPV